MIRGFADGRTLTPSRAETNINSENGPPWRESNLTTEIVVKDLWSRTAVKRPHFVLAGNMDGSDPFIDPKCNQKNNLSYNMI